MDFSVLKELAKFDGKVMYYDEPHEYYINGVKAVSTTQLLGRFKGKFNHSYWLVYKAVESAGLNPRDFMSILGYSKDEEVPIDLPTLEPYKEHIDAIQKEWKYKNNHATYEGSTLHDYIEHHMTNRVFPEPMVSPEGIPFKDISETLPIMREQYHRFRELIMGRLIPVKNELVICDEDYMMGGMIDQLFLNVKHSCLQIYDWKTNTKLQLENSYGEKLKGFLSHLDDCEFVHYSLQLGIYKHILEKNTNIKLGDNYIVWFNEEIDEYQMIKCLDLTLEVEKLLSIRKKEVKGILVYDEELKEYVNV